MVSPKHFGHLLPLLLCEIVACHSCPLWHCHQTFLLDHAVKFCGTKLPFLVGCHSLTSIGIIVEISLYPTRTFLPEQKGQPHPDVLLLIWLCHSCPLSHNHQTFLPFPTVTALGFNSPFLVGCHCNARSGLTVAKSLTPTTILCPEQTGQPTPLFLL